MSSQQGVHGQWQHRWTFILAAVGSAVGLGNIWKFPYIVGENGGGAFVLVYLVCIVLIGIPIMLAEVLLGRLGRRSPINTMAHLAQQSNTSRAWSSIGWMGALCGLLILSFYSVVAGWSFHYLMLAVSGQFTSADESFSASAFNGLLSDPGMLTLWHSVFMLITVAIVASGVVKGLGFAARLMMPLLFVILLILAVYSAVTGEFLAAFSFLFAFDLSALSADAVLVALGHAFFTLSLGMGAIMAYGAYLPEQRLSLSKTVFTVALLDTVVALLAGLVIFPLVFASTSIEPSSGPGLLFVSLPLAFGDMLGGSVFAALFFFLVIIAALSSAISLLEPSIAWLVEEKAWSRPLACSVVGGVIWLLGLGTVFSFNLGASWTLWGANFFEILDFLTSSIMLPLGGLLIALFVAWRLPVSLIGSVLGELDRGYNRYWYGMLRFVSPLLLACVFVWTLVGQ